MGRTYPESASTIDFFPVLDSSGNPTGIEGKVNVIPHPDFPGMRLIRGQVRWGILFFRKILTLETMTTLSK